MARPPCPGKQGHGIFGSSVPSQAFSSPARCVQPDGAGAKRIAHRSPLFRLPVLVASKAKCHLLTAASPTDACEWAQRPIACGATVTLAAGDDGPKSMIPR